MGGGAAGAPSNCGHRHDSPSSRRNAVERLPTFQPNGESVALLGQVDRLEGDRRVSITAISSADEPEMKSMTEPMKLRP